MTRAETIQRMQQETEAEVLGLLYRLIALCEDVEARARPVADAVKDELLSCIAIGVHGMAKQLRKDAAALGERRTG